MLIIVAICMIGTKFFLMVLDFIIAKFLMNSVSNVFYKIMRSDDSDNSS